MIKHEYVIDDSCEPFRGVESVLYLADFAVAETAEIASEEPEKAHMVVIRFPRQFNG